jgi:hypothetical protein
MPLAVGVSFVLRSSGIEPAVRRCPFVVRHNPELGRWNL